MRNKHSLLLGFVAATTCLFSVSSAAPAPDGEGHHHPRGKMVVANRESGTISVIDTHDDEVDATIALPAGDNPPEPMYVVNTPRSHRVWVGDRANDRVVAFDRQDFSVDAVVPAGSGVFHMWADDRGRQLWVNNDIDKTSTVIDPVSLNVLATVPTPADLVAMGGKPHDVILDFRGRYAYVTVLGVTGENDYVVQFDTSTFAEMNRAAVGKDPHVSLARWGRKLFVPCQNSDVVVVLDRRTMQELAQIDLPGAHGAGMARNGRTLYTTNLPNGGVDGLFAINTRTNTVIGDGVDTPYGVPHNIALTRNSRKLYVTHSGPNDKVSVYAIHPHSRLPYLMGEVTVGSNPFGLAYVH